MPNIIATKFPYSVSYRSANHIEFSSDVENFMQRHKWCFDNLPYTGDWRFDSDYFYFKKSEDAVLFALRWA